MLNRTPLVLISACMIPMFSVGCADCPCELDPEGFCPCDYNPSLACCDPDTTMETPEDECPSYDRDCDSISNATENNVANDYLNLDEFLWDANPTLARGGPCSGWITKALNMVNTGTGYYHFLGSDATDTDDWGVLRLIYMIERASRAYFINNSGKKPRVGVGDLSLKDGGDWTPDHNCHQNGLEVDLRYVRNDTLETMLNLSTADSIYFDENKTTQLIHHLVSYGNVDSIFVDTVHTDLNYWFSFIVHKTGHSDHFHVRIKDPDGTAN